MIRALMLSALLLAGQATAADTASNPFGVQNGALPVDQATKAHKPKKPRQGHTAPAASGAGCSNLPTRCSDGATCADFQRALHCGMTRLDRDHDGVACDKQCQ